MRSHGWFVVGITAIVAAVAGSVLSSMAFTHRAAAEPASTSAFTRIDAAGNPARWNPCAALQWKLADSRSSRRLRLAATDVFRQVEAAAGLSFTYAGRATAAEFASPPRNTIVIGATADLGLANAGGMTNVFYAPTANGGWVISGAKVAINPLVVARGTRFTSMLTPIVLHEVGHAMGMAHVSNPSDIMYPQVVRVARYTPGSLEVLSHLGASNGCLTPAVTTG